jgi:ribosomal protein L28
MYEARCRRCFEPNLAHEKIEEAKAAAAAKVQAATR